MEELQLFTFSTPTIDMFGLRMDFKISWNKQNYYSYIWLKKNQHWKTKTGQFKKREWERESEVVSRKIFQMSDFFPVEEKYVFKC